MRAKVTPKNATIGWNTLTDKEKNYAYYMEKADWSGAKMVLHQVSYEAPAIFVLLHAFFQDNNYATLKKKIVDGHSIKDKDFMLFKAYAAAFYQYMGNYHSFGSMKFKPGLDENTFRTILMRHPLYLNKSPKGKLYKQIVNELYPQIKEEIFDTKAPYT
jgi:dipeptidyl-peptidase-3